MRARCGRIHVLLKGPLAGSVGGLHLREERVVALPAVKEVPHNGVGGRQQFGARSWLQRSKLRAVPVRCALVDERELTDDAVHIHLAAVVGLAADLRVAPNCLFVAGRWPRPTDARTHDREECPYVCEPAELEPVEPNCG